MSVVSFGVIVERVLVKIGDTTLKAGVQTIFYDAPNGELFYEGIQRKEQIYGAFLHASHAAVIGCKLGSIF